MRTMKAFPALTVGGVPPLDVPQILVRLLALGVPCVRQDCVFCLWIPWVLFDELSGPGVQKAHSAAATSTTRDASGLAGSNQFAYISVQT